MEGLPAARVISSTEVQIPVISQDRTLPVGVVELTQSNLKTYYASMGVKDDE